VLEEELDELEDELELDELLLLVLACRSEAVADAVFAAWACFVAWWAAWA
jgi:hypothetical protein